MLSITSTEFAIQQEPQGLRDLKHRVYYSPDMRGYLEEWNGELTFYGQDYTYLRNKYVNEGCAIIPVVIGDGCSNTYNANLFLNDATWRPDICEVTLEVVDAGFLSLIDNNMGIKAYLNVPRSKNDIDITTYTTVQTDLVFEASAIADPDVTGREGVRVYDAYKFLIAFMTDGLLEFESDFLFPDDSEPTLLTPVLITANELRNGNTNALYPYISFEELHSDWASQYNLTFNVVNGVFRVEPDSWFQQNSNTITIENPEIVEQTSDEESFYQKVKFGSQVDEEEDFNYYPNITFLGFSQEEYHLGGQCNNKSVLDLEMTTLITDPNIIMQSLPVASGGQADPVSKEDDIFVVTCNTSNTSIVYTHPTDSNLQYYNKLLTNFECALRWGDGVPFPIFQFLGANQNGARGFLSASYSPTLFTINALSKFAALHFPNRIPPFGFDPNTNMSDVTSSLQNPPFIGSTATDTQLKTIYTAPISSIYTVVAKVRFVQSPTIASIAAVRYGTTPSAVAIDWLQGFAPNVLVNGAYEAELSWTVYLDAGDRVAILGFNTIDIIEDSFFQVNDLDFIEKTYNPDDNYLINTTFSYTIEPETWKDFLNDRHGRITVTHKNGIIYGYLREATRNLEDGITDWKIRSTFGDA